MSTWRAVLALAIAMTPAPAYGWAMEPSSVKLRVFNAAHVPRDTLELAMELTAGALRRSGIRAEWMPPCERSMCQGAGREDLEICIMGAGGVSPQVDATVLGTANRAARRVYVFWDRVRASRLASGNRRYAVLAAVMQHEAGHVLGLEHARSGVMRADMRSEEVDQVWRGKAAFAEEEMRRVKAGLEEIESTSPESAPMNYRW